MMFDFRMSYRSNSSSTDNDRIKKWICRPEGSVCFDLISDDIYNKKIPILKIFEITSGHHHFYIVRNSNLEIRFSHFSPGTGTRSTVIDLNNIKPTNSLFITFTWSMDDIRLYVSPMGDNSQFQESIPSKPDIYFRIGKDGYVFTFEGISENSTQVRLFSKGQAYLLPTAIEYWNEIKSATNTLLSGSTDNDYSFELVVCNLIITILVTGFEIYCKRRFLEIQFEGPKPQLEEIEKNLFATDKRKDLLLKIKNHAKNVNTTLLKEIVDENYIKFQNYKQCRLAYRWGYNIDFTKIGVPENILNQIRKFIGYRHKIIHTSPLIPALNQQNIPREEPVFPKKNLAIEAIDSFQSFIEALHKATLQLKVI